MTMHETPTFDQVLHAARRLSQRERARLIASLANDLVARLPERTPDENADQTAFAIVEVNDAHREYALSMEAAASEMASSLPQRGTAANLLAFTGQWAGDDLDARLQEVDATRQPVEL